MLERKLLLLVLQLIYLSDAGESKYSYIPYQHFDILSPTILNTKVFDVQNKEASLEDQAYLNDLKQI